MHPVTYMSRFTSDQIIVIDTSFFVGLVNTRDSKHKRAVELLKELANNIFGQRITLDYILDEAITTTWIRTKNREIVRNTYEMINGNYSIYDMRSIHETLVKKAWSIHEKYFSENKPLSYTDCMIIAFAIENNINQVLSFDDEFDGILERIF